MKSNMSGIPVVILPGLMCDSGMFAGQIGALDAQVVDGFYGGAESVEDMAAYALARMPKRSAVIAHSMGTRVGLEIWRQAPDRFERLMIVNAGVQGLRPNEAEGRHALRDLGRREGFDSLAIEWLGRMISPTHRGDRALVARLMDMCRRAGQSTYEAQIKALLSRPECASLLPSINCPTFVVTGHDDEWAPPAQHEAMAAQIPGAVLRLMENAGHMMPAEKPDQFNEIALEWLAHSRT